MSDWKRENIERKLSQRDRSDVTKAPPAKKKPGTEKNWLVVYVCSWRWRFMIERREQIKFFEVWGQSASEEEARKLMRKHTWQDHMFVVERNVFERVYRPINKSKEVYHE